MLIGFMRILSPLMVNHYKGKIVNVHPSLLPEFAGGMDKNVHEEVLKAGKKKTGCTVHFVTSEVDCGGIIIQKECYVDENETVDTLKTKVQVLEGECLLEVIRRVQRDDLEARDKPVNTVHVSYRDAGVDIEAGDNLVEQIKPYCKATARPGTDAVIGGFGGIFDLKAAGYTDPLLVSGTDGVGTKLQIAHMCGRHDTIGFDLVAMCVNDILVQGAEPLFFLDYFATGKLDVNQAREVVKGIALACKECGCALLGGETAEMPGMYNRNDYDVAGFCVGAVNRDRLIPRSPSDIEDGDILIGLLSSGFHSNGFSLIRHLLSINKIDPQSKPQWEDTHHSRICDALLEPTRLYVRPLLKFLQEGQIKAAAHITGGGIPGNLPRVLGNITLDQTSLRFHVDMASWEIPPLMKFFIHLGSLKSEEALKTWNCGLGMILVCSPAQVTILLKGLEEQGENPKIIGKVIVDPAQPEFVTFSNVRFN
eukprot:TRINITY_DN10183_c0_g2_i11.p1 TRINITY_DN10183_c0_g2~~TRINITY_DN10183_c0_g2_i11.p1  ORF type:complete len:479 (+),score=103.32 TRINITY_DN10183_c0_g2_i11:1330-2766(+)